MESPQLHIERAERCLVMARQCIAAGDVSGAEVWTDIANAENDIAYTQQAFRLHIGDTRPAVRDHLVLVDMPD